MEDSFFAYLQQIELMTFFSGYPLLYVLVVAIAGNKTGSNKFYARMIKMLPFSYALTGTLYIGLQLKNLYIGYSAGKETLVVYHPYLMIWGILSVLFWIPVFSKRKLLALIHSLVFFFFLLKDVFYQFTSSPDKDILVNDMKIYTVSLLLNLGCFILVLLLSFLPIIYKGSSKI
jgi:hypothetical protein